MNVIEFVSAMVPGLKRADVIEDLSLSIKEMSTICKPAYSDADVFFKANRISSDEVKDLSDTFYANFKPHGGKNATFINNIYSVIGDLIENAQLISKEVEKQFEPDMVAEGMTARKASVVRAAEYMHFLSRYMLDLLSYVYFFEAQHSMGSAASQSIEINPVTIKRVQVNMGRFARLLESYSQPTAKFAKIFSGTPDVLVGGANAGVVTSVYPIETLDAGFVQVGSGFIPNPIYHVRMAIAEWQYRRYRESEEKLGTLKLRLMHIKMLNSKQNSPQLEKEISITQSRVDKLSMSLDKDREEVGLPALHTL